MLKKTLDLPLPRMFLFYGINFLLNFFRICLNSPLALIHINAKGNSCQKKKRNCGESFLKNSQTDSLVWLTSAKFAQDVDAKAQLSLFFCFWNIEDNQFS